jgi:hypothetical protein
MTQQVNTSLIITPRGWTCAPISRERAQVAIIQLPRLRYKAGSLSRSTVRDRLQSEAEPKKYIRITIPHIVGLKIPRRLLQPEMNLGLGTIHTTELLQYVTVVSKYWILSSVAVIDAKAKSALL